MPRRWKGPALDPVGVPTVQGRTDHLYTTQTDPSEETQCGKGQTIVYGDGDAVEIVAGPKGVRFLFVYGKPLHEPVAWYGPIVMNTRAEIAEAFSDLQKGTFIRSKKVINEA